MRKTIVAAGAATLTLALATFSGTALAGGGHGGGSSGSSPGNSGNAQSHGQQNQSSRQTTSTVQTGGDNSQGTKPSNTTSHDTYATAGSGHTKRYGNGETAGRIAEQNRRIAGHRPALTGQQPAAQGGGLSGRARA